MLNYFLNFLRAITARPTSPEPTSSMVAGSGTEDGGGLVAIGGGLVAIA